MHRRVAQRLRRLSFAVAVPAALAGLTLGIVASAPASAAAAGSSAPPSTAAPPPSSQCYWVVLPARLFIGDPAATYPMIGGVYNRLGNRDVAYKLTGQFPHSTTMVTTAFNNVIGPIAADNTIADNKVIPDPGSVNPFVPGTLVDGQPRNYTMWLWPQGIPVPKGLQNVVIYPTKSANPRTSTAGWNVTMRLYHMQPGYSARAAVPAIHAVSTADPSRYVRCPLNPAKYYPDLVRYYVANKVVYGGAQSPPEPVTGNKIYFTRYPVEMTAATEGFTTDGCVQYLGATVPLDKISVITMHKVPTHFNNDHITPSTVMGDYQLRWTSLTNVGYVTTQARYVASSINQDDAVFRPKGQWVTVFLPARPVLTLRQLARVRKVAAVLGYNVVQLRVPSPGPLGRTVPPGALFLRQKVINPTFRNSLLSVPCWSNPKSGNNYRDYPYQTSAKFFRQFASGPRNMGAYRIDGVWYDVGQFLARFSKYSK